MAGSAMPLTQTFEEMTRKRTVLADGPLFIGIGHQKRVGKDYFAKKLAKRLRRKLPEKHVAVIPLSRGMKDLAADVFKGSGLGDDAFYEENPDQKDAITLIGDDCLTPREVWIDFANAMRAIDEDVWINRVEMGANVLSADIVIIPDIRFENEAEFVKNTDGLLLKIEADVKLDEDGADDQLKDYDGWDYFIHNDFKPKTIKAQVKGTVEIIMEDYLHA